MSKNRNKLHQLKDAVTLGRFDIVAITETWLDSKVNDSELMHPNYSVYRRDRHDILSDKIGGGVALCINNNISSCRRHDLEPQEEIVVCEVKPNNLSKILFILAYKPPNGDVSQFICNVSPLLKAATSNFKNVCLLGDFNMRNIDWSNYSSKSESGNSFCNMITENSLFQMNNVISNKHGSLLDLVFTTEPNLVDQPVECPIDFDTDHSILTFKLNLSGCNKRKIPRVVYNFKQADFSALRSLITNSNRSLNTSLNHSTHMNEAWSIWSSTVTEHINQCIPRVPVKNSSKHPWMDGEVRHMHNCKHTAWAAAKRTNNVQMWNKFKYLRNKLKLMLRDKRNSFMSDLALSLKNNAKRFWTFCRLNTNSRQIPAVVSDGQNDVTDAADKAKMFNDYFHSVFSTPKTGIALPAVSVKSDNMLANIAFSEIDVINVLKGLDVNKGSGPDDIPLKVLRECADELAPSLTTLFNLSMSTCTLPEVWKYSNVVPIHKKGKKCKVDNYRPISLLNSVSKVMERLVFNHIYPVVSPQINSAQHGFMKHRSTTTQLIDTYSDISKNLDSGSQTDIIFLDFAKAFDSVPHDLIVHKLKTFGFGSNLLQWIENYLQGRYQSVMIEGQVSSPLPVTSGVPQGSIIGPLLFVLYINDICDVCTSFMKLYADDAKLYRNIKSRQDVLSLQNDLNALFLWSKIWRMNFNISKCKFMSICRKVKIDFDYSIDNNILSRVIEFNDLGITITSKLSWCENVKTVSSKAHSMVGMIKRFVGFNSPIDVKRQLYLAHVRSILEYCSPMWSPNHVKDIIKLERVQRQASKFILNDYVSPYHERCTALSILPLCFRREIIDLCFLYSYLHGKLSCDYSSNFELACPHNGLRSAQQGVLFKLPLCKTVQFQCTYFYRTARLWNTLPFVIRDASSLQIFKKNLNELYLAMVNLFDVNNRCTWSLACACVNCRI